MKMTERLSWEMPSAHGGARIEVILVNNGGFIMALINTERLPVAVIIGATCQVAI